MRMCALVISLLTIAGFNAAAQTNAAKTSPVGTWKADLSQSHFESGPAPKAITATILKDAPELYSVRFEILDPEGKPISVSWTGPLDGTPKPTTDATGAVLAQQSITMAKDGALIRHGNTGDVSFDARVSLSPDGKTITDVITIKTADGKTAKDTTVYHRVPGPIKK